MKHLKYVSNPDVHPLKISVSAYVILASNLSLSLSMYINCSYFCCCCKSFAFVEFHVTMLEKFFCLFMGITCMEESDIDGLLFTPIPVFVRI